MTHRIGLARPVSDIARRSGSRAGRRLVAGLALAVASSLAPLPAHARCIHSGAVYTCITSSGPPLLLSCYGTGGVQTCIDSSGKAVVVGQHWRKPVASPPDTASTDAPPQVTATEDVSFDAQLAAALAANPAASRSPGGTTRTKQQRPTR